MNRLTLLRISIPVTFALTAGCGGGESPTGTGAGGGTTSASSGVTTGSGGSAGSGGATSSTSTGGTGPTPGDGAGIQGCAAKFIEADGVCHPALDKCPKGTIPKFDEGCVPVGIPGCSDKFLEADGICHVTMSKCPAGTFAVPTEGCVPIDGAAGCGAAPWGAIADGASTIWVDPTYAGGGSDGSKAKPVTTIAAALALVTEGGRVALAAGDYPESLVPTKSMEVVGRCASMVKITGVTGTGATAATVVIHTTPAGVTLRNLQIGGAASGIVVIDSAATKATLDGIWINKATRDALLVNGSKVVVDVKHTLIQGTLADAIGTLGEGVDVGGGAQVVVDSSAVIDNLTTGVNSLDSGTKITFTNGLVEGTTAQVSDGFYGYGMVANGSALVITGSAIVANVGRSAIGYYPKTSVSITDSVIEKSTPDAASDSAVGLDAELGASVTATRTIILGSRAGGVICSGKGSKATIDQTFIADTTSQAVSLAGDGIEADTGGTVHVLDSALVRNKGAAIGGFGKGTLLDIKSCLLEGTTLVSGLVAPGVFTQTSASATIDSSALVANVGAGLAVMSNSSATLTHSLIAGTLPNVKGNNGGGVLATGATSLAIAASAILENKTFGVFSDGPLTMDGSVIRGVKLGNLSVVKNAPVINGVADGVLLDQGKQAPVAATIAGSLFESCERAGILFANHPGSITGSSATKNRFGLVIQGSPAPDVSADSSFAGNTEKDKVDGGMLPVP